MLGKLRQHILKKAFKKNAKDSKFKSLDDIKSILVLFESDLEENNTSVDYIISDLKNKGKEITACCYINKKEVVNNSADKYTIITKKDVDIWGRPHSEYLEAILQREYDAVIDLTLNNKLPLNHILARVKSQFRCGKHKEGSKYYDFEIELPETKVYPKGKKTFDCGEEKLLGEQIIKYLNQVKSI